MKRLVGAVVLAGAAMAGTVATAPPASAADAGGYCDAYIDVNCYYWTGWGWEQCDLWWGWGCYIDIT
jgi:hypothetical protein